MNEAWKALPELPFPEATLDTLDLENIVPSRVVDICHRWLEDEFSSQYYLAFVELFTLYATKLERVHSEIRLLADEVDQAVSLHAYARVVLGLFSISSIQCFHSKNH